MKKINYLLSLFVIVLTFLTFHDSFSQVTQEWVTRYNGPGNRSDEASSMAMYDSGNVFVTGGSYGSVTDNDYATIKYNSSGVQQWVQRYNGSGNSYDQARAITVDGSGNVYVTGESGGDYATLKYNSSGDSVWVKRYNGPGNFSSNQARSIAVDGSGNVFVTGFSGGSETRTDYATIKYNSQGDSVWVQRYNGSGNSDDYANSIAVDTSGNVYVTGSSRGSGTYSDYATIKYNSSGVQQWVQRYNGPGLSSNEAISIAVDASGNVYVTGSSGNGANLDYATIKYNSQGDSVWVQRYNGPGNSYDHVYSIAIDGSGNVYVTGGSDGIGLNASDYATIKYDSIGVQQWVARYNGPGNSSDQANSIAVDDSSNVFVTGNSHGSATLADYATIKYNSSGVQQWVQRYNGPGLSSDVSISIALDYSGNVYVTGLSFGNGTDWDYATIKYSQSNGIRQISYVTPEQFSLSQNYPNPFNPNTIISYKLQVTSYTKLVVYDVMGKEVAILVNEKQSPGTYQVEFDARLDGQGSNLSSGVYFYRLETGDFTDTKKMLLVK